MFYFLNKKKNYFIIMYKTIEGDGVEKYTWRGTIAEGKKEEYIKRHDSLWPEMAEVLKEAGIRNYTIWENNNELFGYYECEKGVEYAAKVQKESEVVARWNEYMKDILIMHIDKETGLQPKMQRVFEFN